MWAVSDLTCQALARSPASVRDDAFVALDIERLMRIDSNNASTEQDIRDDTHVVLAMKRVMHSDGNYVTRR